MSAPHTTGPRTSWPARLALITVSVVIALAMLEIGCRLLRGPQALLDWSNIILKERIATRQQTDGPMVPDPALGFVPRRNYAKDGRSTDSEGFRRAPAADTASLAEPPILVVGDSIAQGDELGDAEAWPALLQTMLRRRVVNAAATAYGLDQIVLRAESLAPHVRPAALIVSFAADDLRRAEMERVWGVQKPWFRLVDGPGGGKLELRNVPVPPSPEPADTMDAWHWLFGWSVAVDTFLRHRGWQYEWSIDHQRVQPRGEGERLACPLMKRIAALGLPTLVVAEYNRWVFQDRDYGIETRRQTALVLTCAAEAGLQTLDGFEAIERGVKEKGLDGIFLSSHPGPEGARLAAEGIAASIRKIVP